MDRTLLKYRFWLLGFCLAISVWAPLRGQGTPGTLDPNQIPRHREGEFRVLSWNIKMLPRVVNRVRIGPIRRARAIARRLKEGGYEMLILQECFDSRVQRILKRELKFYYPHVAGPANHRKAFSFKTNSGVMIFSHLPIRVLEEIDFEGCEGEDCYARKGALLIKTEVHGQPLQIVGTHLEAGGPDEIYLQQYQEIRELMDRHVEAGVPQLLCGDFNTNPAKDRYQKMIETLQVENGPVINEDSFPPGYLLNDLKNPKRRSDARNPVDYLFLRDNGAAPSFIERRLVVYREPWDKKHDDLSDHYPLMFRLAW